ncbi:MAG: hypothetical protein ABI977_19060 [Acidobacteriota bacterium]
MNDQITEPKFKHRVLANFFLRFHMALILSAVCLSGVISSKLLLKFGITSMPVRYPIAVCCAYAIFFLSVRLWLWYIGISPRARDYLSRTKNQRSQLENGGGTAFDLGSSSSASGDSSGAGFGGGGSGGGGASDSWGEAPAPGWLSASEPVPATVGSSYKWGSATSGKSDWFDFDFGDDGCLGVIVLLLLMALLAAIFGAGAYLIYEAPVIFGEAAFQAALASGLIKASKEIDNADWKGSVFKATWMPFAIVLTLAIAFGLAAHRYCPAATKASEVFKACK